MKILIVRTFPNIINPHQYNVQEIGLAKALTRKGYQCGIVLYNGNKADSVEHVPVLCEDGISREFVIYRLRGIGILKNGFFPSLGKIVKQYDVIQVHEYDQITSWLLYAWSKKKIVIYHGPYYHQFNKGYNFKCKVFDSIFLRIRHNRDVVCMTKSTLATDFLISKGFRNVKTVGVGLDLGNFGAECKEEIPIDPTKKNVIYIGKIEERRNSLFLLEIMKELHRKDSEVNCIIIGNGETEYVQKFLSEAESMKKEGYLQYYEKASQSQLARLYGKAQLMLFPSNYEIYGMVLSEAAHFGLPVVTSQNGGADIFLQEHFAGKVLVDFDLKTWVDASLELLSRSVNRDVLQEQKQKKLSWDAKVDDFVEGYNA